MRFQSYFNTAVQIINAYDGGTPLAHYLKQYFSLHKKHGSKDRKYIAHLCYCYYRLGHALKETPVEERLKTALFLCNDHINEWAVVFNNAWLTNHTPILTARIHFIKTSYPFNTEDIFPWPGMLSNGIDTAAFATSHLIQPDLFLRTRPGKKKTVLQKLVQQNIPFVELDESALALPNTTKIDTVIQLNKEAVVQDYSSQQIQKFLLQVKPSGVNPSALVRVWDCCAASGGKSILAYDSFANIELTVSDIRQSIIHNLQQRFKDAGIYKYKSFVADLSVAPSASLLKPYPFNLTPFDLVICDAPCTGSGTWGRTPEQLYFFNQTNISHYTSLQQKITRHVLPLIRQGGYFLYITCSVFKRENEDMIEILTSQNLTLISKQVLTGYNIKADTMFAALFKK